MSGPAPGANSRGRGGKFRKFTRGGGKHFSRDLRPLDADGNEISMWSEDAQRQLVSNSDNTESESESSEEDEAADQGTLTREERRKEKKARKEAAVARKNAQAVEVGDLPPSDDDDDDDDDDAGLANPNHSKAARKQTRIATSVDEVTEEVGKVNLNRKERESADAAAARERYRLLHEQGKTDEAKADMARLKLIREQREAEAARRKAEKEERDDAEKARKAERDAKMAALDAKKVGKKLK